MIEEQNTNPVTVQNTDIWAVVEAYNKFVLEMDQFMELMKAAIGISTAELTRSLDKLNKLVPYPAADGEALKRVFDEIDVEIELDGDDIGD